MLFQSPICKSLSFPKYSHILMQPWGSKLKKNQWVHEVWGKVDFKLLEYVVEAARQPEK